MIACVFQGLTVGQMGGEHRRACISTIQIGENFDRIRCRIGHRGFISSTAFYPRRHHRAPRGHRARPLATILWFHDDTCLLARSEDGKTEAAAAQIAPVGMSNFHSVITVREPLQLHTLLSHELKLNYFSLVRPAITQCRLHLAVSLMSS